MCDKSHPNRLKVTALQYDFIATIFSLIALGNKAEDRSDLLKIDISRLKVTALESKNEIYFTSFFNMIFGFYKKKYSVSINRIKKIKPFMKSEMIDEKLL
jgi:hypothetical protein